MKQRIQNCLFLVLTSLGVVCQLAANTAQATGIQYTLPNDGRKWKVAYQSKPEEPQSVTQMILDSQTPESATELVTVQTIPGINLEPAQFFSLLIKQIQQSLPKSKVESKIINSTPDSLLAEWWMNDAPSNSQHEWMRIIKKDDTISILRYTTKNMDGVEQSRSIWEKILSDAHL